MHLDSAEFADACAEAYESTYHTDRGLRDVIIQTFRANPELSMRQDVEMVVRETQASHSSSSAWPAAFPSRPEDDRTFPARAWEHRSYYFSTIVPAEIRTKLKTTNGTVENSTRRIPLSDITGSRRTSIV